MNLHFAKEFTGHGFSQDTMKANILSRPIVYGNPSAVFQRHASSYYGHAEAAVRPLLGKMAPSKPVSDKGSKLC
jgi:hypothetical protein